MSRLRSEGGSGLLDEVATCFGNWLIVTLVADFDGVGVQVLLV